MALSVTTEFSADVTNGIPPSFDVQFTDETIVVDGFAREWFWDFGDGESSTEQNPLHTYNGIGGDMFTVRLSVLVTSGEFDALIVTDTSSTGVGSFEQAGTSLVSEQEAWDLYQLDTPSAGSLSTAAWQLVRTGGTDRQYKRIDSTQRITTGFDNALHVLSCNPSNFTNFLGMVSASLGGSLSPTNNDTKQLMGTVPGLTIATPLDVDCMVRPIVRLPDVGNNQQSGLNCSFTLRSFRVSSSQTHDTETKTDYIGMGTPPIAAFSGSPLVGFNPLSVQFENLSTPAVGLPTTYSWKKRINGSGDSFVEFSTAENPSEDFAK